MSTKESTGSASYHTAPLRDCRVTSSPFPQFGAATSVRCHSSTKVSAKPRTSRLHPRALV